MYTRIPTAVLALMLASGVASAQTANPVAQAFRDEAASAGKNLMAAAADFPEAKYGYKPTPAQMSFHAVVRHLIQGNDYLCGTIAGVKAPTRSKLDSTATKDALVARLKETFAFCDQALAGLDDSKLAESLPIFGRTMTRRLFL